VSDDLYYIDGPNIGEGAGKTTYEDHQNYLTYLTWNGMICSATNNYWHFVADLNEANSPKITHTDLGSGLTTLPTTPQY
jgi:hypothetical protein